MRQFRIFISKFHIYLEYFIYYIISNILPTFVSLVTDGPSYTKLMRQFDNGPGSYVSSPLHRYALHSICCFRDTKMHPNSRVSSVSHMTARPLRLISWLGCISVPQEQQIVLLVNKFAEKMLNFMNVDQLDCANSSPVLEQRMCH